MTEINNALLYGQAIADKIDAVEAALEEINNKYKSYFAGIKSKYAADDEDDTPAKLQDYVIRQWNKDGASISITQEVPEHIAKEASEAFSRIISA